MAHATMAGRGSRTGGLLLFAALTLQAAPGAHAVCGTTAAAAAGISTIQSAVDSAPPQLTAGDHCVSIESGIFAEQVTVRGIDANGFRIIISAAPGASVTVVPPAGSQAAFVIGDDNVTLAGLSVRTGNPMPYGIYAPASHVDVSSVSVFSHEGNITSAGIVLGSRGRISTTYVGVRLAHALFLPGSQGTSVSYSIFETSGPAVSALHLTGASGNSFTGLLASNRGGHCASLTGKSSSNTVELSTFTAGLGGHGAFLDGGSGNRILRSVLIGGGNIDYGDGGHGLKIKGGDSNAVEESFLFGGKGGFAGSGGSGAALEADADSNAIRLSTLTGGAGGLHPAGYPSAGGNGLLISGSRSNSVEQSALKGSAGGDCKGGGGGPGGHGLSVTQGTDNGVSRTLLVGGIGGGGGVHDGGFGGHGAYLNASSRNSISQSQLNGGPGAYGKGGPGLVPGEGGHGFYASGGGSNSVDHCLMAGGAGGTGDAIMGGGGGGGLTLSASASNTISQSVMTGGLGGVSWSSGAYGADGAGAGLLANAKSNTISLSTITSAGTGVWLRSGSSGLTLFADRVTGGAQAAGMLIESGTFGTISLNATSIQGARTGISFLGGTAAATLAGMVFPDAGMTFNVDASLLAPSSRIVMTDAQGTRAGPAFENDPKGLVDWVASGVPPEQPGRPAGAVLGASSISWTWSAAANATGYRIFSAADPATLIASVGPPAFLQAALSPNTTYAIVAAGVNGGLLGPLSAEAAAVRTLAAPPAAPALAQVRTSSITLSWSANGNPAGTLYRAQLWTAGGTTTTLTSAALTAAFTGLSAQTRYYLGLAALNADGIVSPAASVLSATTLPEPPAAPAWLMGAALGASSISWTWSAVSSATSYQLFKAADPAVLVASVGTTSFVAAGLAANTAYGVAVAGVNAAGPGPLSAAATAHTLAAPPAAPAATQVKNDSISFSWSANKNPPGTRYSVQLWAGTGATTTLSVAVTSAAFTGLSPETTYYLALAALNAAGIPTPSSTVLRQRTLPDPPPAPAGLTGTALGRSSMTWVWNAAAGAAGYYFYPSAGGPAVALATTNYTQTGLSANTAHAARVSARNAGGEGPLAAAATSYTLAAPPSGFALLRVHSSSVTLSWGANTNPAQTTSYRVDLWQASGATTSAAVMTTSATVSGLSGGATYYLTVSALNALGAAAGCGSVLTAVTAPGPSATGKIDVDGGTLAFEAPAGKITVVIPPKAFLKPVNLTLSLPYGFPTAASSVLSAAGTGVGVQITVDQPVQPAADVLVSVSYRQADVADLPAGVLSLARYDEDRRMWVPLVSDVDAVRNTVTGRTHHFSLFQIMQTVPASTVDTAKAFPNPLRPSQGHTTMTFADLPAGARIRIYDLSGGLVRDLTANAAGLASWDGTNESGKKAASGVYFVFAQGAGGKRTFKVAIQR